MLWRHGRTWVVLTPDEVTEFVRHFSDGSATEQIGFLISENAHRRYTKLIFSHLKRSLFEDPEGFYDRYVFRSCYHDEARRLFPSYLHAYGLATGRARDGSYDESELADALPEQAIYGDGRCGAVQRVTLYERVIWFGQMAGFRRFNRVRASGRIAFPEEAIEKLAGRPDDFVLMGRNFNIRFGETFVRLSVHPAPAVQGTDGVGETE